MMLRVGYIVLFVVAFVSCRESLYSRNLFPVGFDNLRLKNTARTSSFHIPASVKDLYRTYAINDGTGKNNRENITVHCFTGQASPVRNAIVFYLNVSGILIDAPILSADIRVMVEYTAPQPTLPSRESFVMYDLFTQRSVQSAKIHGRGDRSLVFPVLALVKRWIHSPRFNRGVYILHKTHLNNSVHHKLMIDSEADEGRDNWPLLVVQTQSMSQKINTLSVWTRYSQLANLNQTSRHAREIRDEGPCSRRPMRVRMGKGGLWKDVILPKFYDSYRCGGDCKFPLEEKVNPTNHAIIRSTLYSAGQDQGSGEPCCVPTKLRGLSTIEYRANHFRMKFYKDMIVEECGCR